MRTMILKKEKWILAILAAAAILSFLNIFPNQFLNEDFDSIVDWPLIRSFDYIPRFFIGYVAPEYQQGMYTPVRTMLFFLAQQIFKMDVFWYHVLALCVHMAGVWCVYALIRLLTGNRTASFAGGIMFAVHFGHAGGIAGMSAAIETVGTVLLFASVYFYVRMFGDGPEVRLTGPLGTGDPQVNSGFYRWSLFFAGLAVFTHERAHALPALILFYDAFFSPDRLHWKRTVKRTLPFIGLFLLYALLKQGIMGGAGQNVYPAVSVPQSIGGVFEAWGVYISAMILPSVIGVSEQAAAFNLRVMTALIAAVFWAGIGILWYRRQRPLAAFCAGWFFISLLPVSWSVPESLLHAQRDLYGTSFAVFCLAGYLCARGYERLSEKNSLAAAFFSAAVGVMVAFFWVMTVVGNRDYRHDRAFYERAVRLSPSSSLLRSDLGILYLDEGRFEEALKHFEAAAAMDPDNSEIYFSMEPAYSALERYDEGVAALKKAVELNPDYAEAHFNLAGIQTFLDQEQDGLDSFSRAVDIWRRKGMIIEAGEAFESFQLFLLDRKGLLEELDPSVFLDPQVPQD